MKSLYARLMMPRTCPRFARLMVVVLVLLLGDSVSAANWLVIINLTAGELQDYPVGEELEIPDNGEAVSFAGMPASRLSYSRDQGIFTLSTNDTVRVSTTCTAELKLFGSAPVDEGRNTSEATGKVAGSMQTVCQVQDQVVKQTVAATGSFKATRGNEDFIAVVEPTGNVTITTRMGDFTTGNNVHVTEGSLISTGPHDTAVVTFSDGTVVKLNPGTSLLVSKNETSLLELFLRKGKVLIAHKLKKLNVRTPTIAMAVRGTDFSVAYVADASSGTSTVEVDSGSVEVTDNAGQSRVLTAGGKTTVVAPVTAAGLQTTSGALSNGATDTSAYAAGISVDGGITFSSRSGLGDLVSIEGFIIPNAVDVGKLVALYMVDNLGSGFFMKDKDGNFLPWNSRVPDLVPFVEQVTLERTNQVKLFVGKITVPGTHQIFLGYKTADGLLHYSPTPARLQVGP